MEVNDICEVRAVWNNGKQNAINVFHLKVTAKAGTGTDLTTICTGFIGTFLNLYKACVSSAFLFKGIKYRQIAPAVTADSISTTGAGAGTLATDQLPSMVCGLISVRAATAPPRVRGRVYVPPADEASNTAAGIPTAGYITALGTFMTQVMGGVVYGGGGNTNTAAFAVKHGKNPATMTAFQVTSYLTRAEWATQRRRGGINRADVPAI